MKNIILCFLLFFACSCSSNSFTEAELNQSQQKEFAILTEGCKKTTVVYTDQYGNKFPVFYDVAQKATFYVCINDGHVKTVDLQYHVANVD